ncbi:MAG: hypothetical protein PHS82_15560 [Lachnospiraceae bacterium]|nr:hypothetical protein [Lachnospiraceae bacterium]
MGKQWNRCFFLCGYVIGCVICLTMQRQNVYWLNETVDITQKLTLSVMVLLWVVSFFTWIYRGVLLGVGLCFGGVITQIILHQGIAACCILTIYSMPYVVFWYIWKNILQIIVKFFSAKITTSSAN